MKRPHGAPPVTLCVVTAAILVLHIAFVLYIRHQIGRLEARVEITNPGTNLELNYERDTLPARNRPSGKLASDAGMLAAFRELNGTLPRYLWLTGLFFLASLAWLRAPRAG